MTPPPVRRVLIQCDGAPIPAAMDAQPWTDRRAITSGTSGGDLDLHIQELAGTVLTRVGPRASDLIHIAAYVYRADQMISRGEPDNADNNRWVRHLALCMPVTDPTYWSNGEVMKRLVATLHFLTDDMWEFTFSQTAPATRQIPLDVQDHELLGTPKAVVLVSGGIDSLCVLLEAAADGERPVAVGHWSAPPHQARQKNLLIQVREKLPVWQFPQCGVRIYRQGAGAADNSQRTRAFLFASLGAGVAGEIGVERVYLGDNGPVSINLPINDQLVGALASRSTHPRFLAHFNALVTEMFATPVVVSNPLAGRTRAEALEVLKRTHGSPLLRETLSCSKWRGLPAATPHCGGCSQCVDRRFATVAAGLEAHDPPTRYKQDVFIDDLPGWDDRTTALSYVRFAQEINRHSDQELVEMFPQIYDALLPDDPAPEETMLELLELTKRHARTVLDVLKAQTQRHLEAMVDGTLPPTCLIRLAAAHGRGVDLIPQEVLPQTMLPAPSVAAGEENGHARPSDATNAFSYSGGIWTISFRGVTAHLKHEVGLLRIAGLLAAPAREFTPFELVAATEPAEPSERVSSATAEADGLEESVRGVLGTVIDNQARAAYEGETRRLLREIDVARDAGNDEQVAEFEEAIGLIAHHLDAATGLMGQLRLLQDDTSTLRNALHTSLRRALKKIDRVHPDLGQHLSHSLRRRSVFVYDPDTPTEWAVTLP